MCVPVPVSVCMHACMIYCGPADYPISFPLPVPEWPVAPAPLCLQEEEEKGPGYPCDSSCLAGRESQEFGSAGGEWLTLPDP